MTNRKNLIPIEQITEEQEHENLRILLHEIIDRIFDKPDYPGDNCLVIYKESGKVRVIIAEAKKDKKDMNKKEVIDSANRLICDIDKCIEDIVSARLERDAQAEGRAMFLMESLMVGSMQELSFLRDYIEDMLPL